VVGYCGGTSPSPTYEAIGDHTEALRVSFDPRRLSLEAVLRMFWREHTPMPAAFTGTQYRSAIFCHDGHQREAAARVKKALTPSATQRGSSPLDLTSFEDAADFYRAEEYHQQWIAKQRGVPRERPRQGEAQLF